MKLKLKIETVIFLIGMPTAVSVFLTFALLTGRGDRQPDEYCVSRISAETQSNIISKGFSLIEHSIWAQSLHGKTVVEHIKALRDLRLISFQPLDRDLWIRIDSRSGVLINCDKGNLDAPLFATYLIRESLLKTKTELVPTVREETATQEMLIFYKEIRHQYGIRIDSLENKSSEGG